MADRLSGDLPLQLIALFVVLLLSPPPQAVKPVGTGTIIGHVVDGDNGQRIGGVTVQLSGGGLPSSERAVTDADGTFVFRAVPAGTFSILVKGPGYLDAYLRRHPTSPIEAVKLGDGERRDDLSIRMFKAAVILGTITDDTGEPVVNVPVVASKRRYMSGHAVFQLLGVAMTDDRGVYRIGRLDAGDYIVSAPMVNEDPAHGPVRDGGSSALHLPKSDGKLQKFPTTYYATGRTASEATVVSIGNGDTRRNVDIQLRSERVLNVSGVVTAAKGSARGVHIELAAIGEDEMAGGYRSTASSLTSEGGAFSLSGIPAGQYMLRAFVQPTAAFATERPQWTEELIALGDKDLTGVALFLRGGVRITGRVELDGQSDEPQWALGLTVSIEPARAGFEAAMAMGAATPPSHTAIIDVVRKTFAFDDVLPGRYLVRVTAPGSRAVKSVIYQGRDVSQTPFDLNAADVNGVVVTLTDSPTVLTGTVSGSIEAGDASVLFFPQDPQSWTDFGLAPPTFRVVDVAPSGAFEVRGLPAGDYFMAAFESDTVIDWSNPSFLRAASRVASRLRLTDGDKRSVDLKVSSIK